MRCAMLKLANQYGNKPVSSREIATQGKIPYQLTCKIMQKLHDAKLVKSCMGPKGGFRLSKDPSQISVLEVIEAIQGPVKLNRCLLGNSICPQQKKCKVRGKLAKLEDSINNYLSGITLDELVKSRRNARREK